MAKLRRRTDGLRRRTHRTIRRRRRSLAFLPRPRLARPHEARFGRTPAARTRKDNTIRKLRHASPPWLWAVESFKILHTSHAQAQIDGDRAQEARGPQSASGTCCLRTAPIGRKRDVFLVPF